MTALTSQSIPQLLLDLAKAQHDARLGNDVSLALYILDVLQHLQALPESCPRVPHIRRQTLGRLDIVREDVQSTLRHQPDHVEIAREVARQRLHQQIRLLLLDLADRLGEMPRAPIGQVVAVDARQHHVAEPPPRQRLGRVLGLVRVQRGRAAARLDAAEAAGTRARVAHEHDGRRRRALAARAAPALAHVGAPRLLAHRVQLQSAQVGLDLGEVGIGPGRRDARLEEVGQPCHGAPPVRRADLGRPRDVDLARGEAAWRGGDGGKVTGPWSLEEVGQGGDGLFEIARP